MTEPRSWSDRLTTRFAPSSVRNASKAAPRATKRTGGWLCPRFCSNTSGSESNDDSATPRVEFISGVRMPSLAKTGAIPATATNADTNNIDFANRVVIVFALASPFEVVVAPYRATAGVVVESVLSSHKTNCHNRLDRMDDCNSHGNRRYARRRRSNARHPPQNTARI